MSEKEVKEKVINEIADLLDGTTVCPPVSCNDRPNSCKECWEKYLKEGLKL